MRAYGDAASKSLDVSGARTHYVYQRYRVRFTYDDTSQALHLINSVGGLINETSYTEETQVIVDIRVSTAAEFEQRFVEVLGGRGLVQMVEEQE